MKLSELAWVGIMGLLPVAALAQLHDGEIDATGWIHTDKVPDFRSNAAPREGDYQVGSYVGVFGGGNLYQHGDLDVTSPYVPGVTATLKTKSQLGYVGGIREGYTFNGWNGYDEMMPNFVDGSFHVLPTIQVEAFATGFKYKAKQNFYGVDTQFASDTNIYVFSLDPIVKFQIGAFRPYFGLGVGLAYVTADTAHLDASGYGLSGGSALNGSDECFAFALQGLLGCEYFVAHNVSVSFDYKWLDLFGTKLEAPNNEVTYKIDSLGQQLVTLGLNVYF